MLPIREERLKSMAREAICAYADMKQISACKAIGNLLEFLLAFQEFNVCDTELKWI